VNTTYTSLNQIARMARLRREMLCRLFVKHCPMFVINTFTRRPGGAMALAMLTRGSNGVSF
jgi:hypothetical protein